MEYVTPSGHVVLLDDDLVLPGRLSIGSHGYAQLTGVQSGRVVLLHRWLLGLRVGDPRVGDHINRRPLDCRRENLRIVTPSDSNLNRSLPVRDLPLHVTRTRSGRFLVSIKRQRRQFYVGIYSTVAEAVEARDAFLKGEVVVLPTADLRAVREELGAIKALMVQLVDIQLKALELQEQRHE